MEREGTPNTSTALRPLDTKGERAASSLLTPYLRAGRITKHSYQGIDLEGRRRAQDCNEMIEKFEVYLF